ncbi:helix-turn-helix domain-containing protein [Halomonas sp. G11]|jgi:transcriptional regulator with XRE-family HTH domain|uniref:helix-turn-helix domain-containing protein n=1 Tax=Halomonas sp. G11 TaxID=1684425 RepID=UPI0009ED0D05|nr:helix-turn-helix transcriptional regulator [Halomonas sp. G11]
MGLKLLKLTAIELSKRAGITRSILRNIENGEADSEISRDRDGGSLPDGSF